MFQVLRLISRITPLFFSSTTCYNIRPLLRSYCRPQSVVCNASAACIRNSKGRDKPNESGTSTRVFFPINSPSGVLCHSLDDPLCSHWLAHSICLTRTSPPHSRRARPCDLQVAYTSDHAVGFDDLSQSNAAIPAFVNEGFQSAHDPRTSAVVCVEPTEKLD